MIPGMILLFLLLLTLAASYVCYRMAFRARREPEEEAFPLPQGEEYGPYREQMIGFIRQLRAMPCQPVEITSYDGLTLKGKFYEYAPDAPIELMLHGYRGNAQRDLSGGVQRCFALGHSALLVDQRCCGDSQGRVITFGLRESRDCLSWVDFLGKTFGPQRKILLTGISMGASTVLLAAGSPLPDNVVGVLADCGFTSAKEIICHVIRTMGLPAKPVWPLVRLGALVFGGFDPTRDSAREAMGRCRIPVLFFHGEADGFVPCSMSEENCRSCAAPSRLVTVPGAGHGLSYLADPQGYLEAMEAFSREYWQL